MLSVNSNPTSVMAFKGKPKAKYIKKAYELVDAISYQAKLTKEFSNNPKEVQREFFIREVNSRLNRILNFINSLKNKFKSIS